MFQKPVWQVFWKTFAQLALAVALAAQGYNWASDGRTSSFAILGFGLLMAFLGAIVASAQVWLGTPATTAFQKAIRSFVQTVVGAIGALVINSAASVVAFSHLLIPLLISAALAFAVTYFQNQGQVMPTPVVPPTT